MAAIPFEIRDQAEEMYIADGLTLDQVAKALNVSIQALKQWSVKYEWKNKRAEYRDSIGQIKRGTALLRKRLIAKALQSLDPRDVYSFARIEGLAQSKGAPELPEMPGVEVEARKITSPQEAVCALQEVIETKLNSMLSQPGAISLANVKDLKKALELIDELKERYQTDEPDTGRKQLADETIRKIKEDIYGII